jgi:hypothetical protein
MGCDVVMENPARSDLYDGRNSVPVQLEMEKAFPH